MLFFNTEAQDIPPMFCLIRRSLPPSSRCKKLAKVLQSCEEKLDELARKVQDLHIYES